MLDKLPWIDYNNVRSRNLLQRGAVVETVLAKTRVFYPYQIGDFERPDTIAYDYYGDSALDWLVLYCNNIINQYEQWPKTQQQLVEHILLTYGSLSGPQQLVDHYKFVGINDTTNSERLDKNYKMSVTTFVHSSQSERTGWAPVTLYDRLVEENEAKRNIRLISNVYLPQIKQEIGKLF